MQAGMHRIFQISHNVNFILSEKKLVRLSDGHVVKLRSPASFCLLLLLEKQGELVSHNELFQFGWERFGMSVSLNVLHNTIYHLRKSLTEVGDFDHKIIETINRRGFIFTKKIKLILTFSRDENGSEPDSLPFAAADAIVQDLPLTKTQDTDKIVKNIHVDSAGTDLDADIQNSIPDCISNSLPSLLDPEDNERSNEEPSLDTPIKSRITNIILIPTLAILTIIMSLQVHQLYSLRALFPARYSYTGDFEKCQVYQNKSGLNFRKLSFTQNIAEYCTDKRFLYVSSYVYSNNISAIICDEKISLFSNDRCISNYLIHYNAYEKNE